MNGCKQPARHDGILYVCMVTHIARVWIKPGKVANPARGQLNRENNHFPVRVHA